MTQPIRVILLEDEVADAELILRHLRRDGFDPQWKRVQTEADFLAALDSSPDLILSDYAMPQFDGFRAMELLRARAQDIPFILVSGALGEEAAVEAVKRGVTDYVVKDRMARIGHAVHRALEEKRLRAERRRLADQIENDVSARHQTEEALRESEWRLNTLFHASPAAICVNTVDSGRMIDANECFAQFVGFAHDELVARTVFDLKLWVDPEARSAVMTRLKTERSLHNFEARFRRKNGEVRDVLVSCELVELAGEPEPVTISMFLDVTDRKRAEARLASFSCLGLRLSAASTAQQAGEIIVDVADQLLGWDACTLDLYDAERDRLDAVLNRDIVQGRRSDVPPAYTGTTPSPRARGILESGAQLILREPGGPPPTDALPFGDVNRRSASIMAVPVRNGVRTIGILSIQSYTPYAYTPEDLKTLQALADYCGGALDRVQTSEALRRAEEKFHSIFDNAVEGIFQTTPEGTFLTVNRAMARNFGYASPEEMMRDRTDIALQVYADPAKREEFKRLLETQGVVTGFEHQARHKDGSLVWVSENARVVRDSSGRVLYYEGTVEDITQRKQAENALAQERKLLRILIDHLPDPIYVKDTAGRYVLNNEADLKSLGVARLEEPIGKTVFDFFPPDIARRFAADDQKVVETGQPVLNREEPYVDRHGKEGWFLTTKVPLRNAEGKVIGLVGISRDVTEKKKLEDQFLRAQRLESVGTLAGGIAHDLNNILAPVLMAVHLLRERIQDNQSRQLLSLVEANAQRGADLVKQILTFARGSQSKLIWVALKHLLTEVAKIAQETFPRAIRVQREFPADLWPVLGDPTHLHQVLMNLCVNARDAMPRGGTLTLHAANLQVDEAFAAVMPGVQPGPYVLVEVSDTGSGIPREILDKIFDPFFTTKGEGKGTGLGLSTVLGIVKGHGGWLTVDRKPRQGTSFRVYLPARPRAGVEPVQIAPKATPVGHGELILVVDDEEAIRKMARTVLSHRGYEVVVAADGPEAIVSFTQQCDKIQLVITDLMMPYMAGEAVIQALKKIRPQIRVIASSGVVDGKTADGWRTLGADAFLPKPYTVERLVALVREVLEERQALVQEKLPNLEADRGGRL